MSIHHTSVVAINVTAHHELLCMLATFVYVFVGMHSELSYLDLQRSPWTPSLRTTPWKCFLTLIGRNAAQPGNQFPPDSYSYLEICCIQVHVHKRRLHSLQQKLKSTQQPVHVAMEYFWNTACVSLLEEPRRWSPSSRWTILQADPFFYVLVWDVLSLAEKTLQTWGPNA